MSLPEWCARVRPGMFLIATPDAVEHMGVEPRAQVLAVHYIGTQTAEHYAFAVKCDVRRVEGAKPLRRTKELGYPWFAGIVGDEHADADARKVKPNNGGEA